VSLAEQKKLDPLLKDAAGAALHQATWRDVKDQAEKLFPLPAGKDNAKLPAIADLLALRGDVERGKAIFRNAGTCANCHIVDKFGKEVGPDLSEIGNKLSRQAMYESVLFPSAGIDHNYESYFVETKSGNIVTGLLVSKTPQEVSIKGVDAIVRKFPMADVEQFLKQPISLMAADLTKSLTAEDSGGGGECVRSREWGVVGGWGGGWVVRPGAGRWRGGGG
jgi:putative heme-binding domain-containing protein